MPATTCHACGVSRAVVLRPRNHARLCAPCFLDAFEKEIHETITSSHLFQRGETVAVGASGGKDSTVLASVLKTLNERHDYGINLVLLSVDEGITGYRDDSLQTVKRNSQQYSIPLEIVDYKTLYGWTMDEVVSQVGKKGNCTYCGVFRRQALDRGAEKLGLKHVVTGHNADDVAETVLMNLLRGDLPRLARSTSIVTESASSPVKRSKPLKYAYEKEIVLYAHHKKLDYFSTECVYSPEAFRGSARALVKNLERVRPSSILDIVRSGEDMALLVPGEPDHSGSRKRPNLDEDEDEDDSKGCGSSSGHSAPGSEASKNREAQRRGRLEELETEVKLPNDTVGSSKTPRQDKPSFDIRDGSKSNSASNPKSKRLPHKQNLGQCEKCGYMSSQAVCKTCTLIEHLNKSKPHQSVNATVEMTNTMNPG